MLSQELVRLKGPTSPRYAQLIKLDLYQVPQSYGGLRLTFPRRYSENLHLLLEQVPIRILKMRDQFSRIIIECIKTSLHAHPYWCSIINSAGVWIYKVNPIPYSIYPAIKPRASPDHVTAKALSPSIPVGEIPLSGYFSSAYSLVR